MNHTIFICMKGYVSVLLLLLLVFFFANTKSALAQASPSVLYVPLIGLTSVPEPLALPNGPGKVTYKYAVKNFLREIPLTEIKVIDDKCTSIQFMEGDDNSDSKLDYDETWRFSCTTQVEQTTESVAIATGRVNTLTATHKAYSTVVVGQQNPAPLVSIVNITKVAYPLSLPKEGGEITYTYKVNNPGVVPLANVSVTDDKCTGMSGKLGDTNANNLLDISEVWIYTCAVLLTETTTNTVNVVAFANGLKAVDNYTITVHVDTQLADTLSIPNFPDAGQNPGQKTLVWKILLGILIALVLVFVLTRKRKPRKRKKL